MPWCEPCHRFFTPTSLRADGTCPACGASVAAWGSSQAATSAAPSRAPWHFKALVGALVLYLGFRAWQGVSWVVHHL
ncbi:MAG: hypothetical protein ACYDAD_09475 [Acidimicrobiales bacterium]